MASSIFFTDLDTLLRIVVVGVLAYFALVFIIRVSGKRTLASLNAFDFIITVAIGSTLATVLLSRDISIVDGVVGFLILIGLQYIVSWTYARSRLASWLIKNQPRLLYYRGELYFEVLKQERLTESDILQALRAQGIASYNEVDAIVLETNGHISTLKHAETEAGSTLSNVRGFDRQV